MPDSDEDLSYIAPGIRHLATPLEALKLLPGNYHHGDVDAVAKSYERFGQRKSITAQRDPDTGALTITAGNTQWKAANRLGWSHIAVEIFDDDETTAIAWSLADNRTAELGYNDDEALAGFLAQLQDDLELLDTTGYDLLDYEMLNEEIPGLESMDEAPISEPTPLTPGQTTPAPPGAPSLSPPYGDEEESEGGHQGVQGAHTPAGQTEPAPPPAPPRHKPGRPVIQYAIIFEDEEQQKLWYAFIKWLRSSYPDHDTIASRLDDFLEGVVPEEFR